MKDGFQFRDVFNPALVVELGDQIATAWPEFNRRAFVDEVNSQLLKLNFGERSSLIADALRKYLPKDFPTAANILIHALGPEPESDSLSGFDGFIIMPQCLFVSRYGLDHYDISIQALYEMTKRFTAEGDIRPFIDKYPHRTLAFLNEITRDKSPFARRLASEGTRPRLPLAPRLPQFQDDPTPVVEILEKLKEDPNLMVRRSVANNLNDIAKDNPDVVVEILERWQRIDNQDTQWILPHALRTLLKQGHPKALQLMGYDPDLQITVSDLELSTPEVAIGDELAFTFTVTSRESEVCQLMIDYIVYYIKANGKQAPKVFKAAKKSLAPGETIRVEKRRSFQQRSTRKHYPGTHSLEVQINGNRYTRADFDLV